MRAGRPRKPTALKVLEGNPGKRVLNMKEPKPKPLIPEKPAWMKGIASEEWDRISDKLAVLGLLTEVDGAALAGYCQCYMRWVQAETFLEDFCFKGEKFNGFMFKSPKGYLQQMPQVGIAQRYAKLMCNFLAKFGLSPSDRAGLGVTPVADAKQSRLGRTLSG